jgi:hypothetical protein
MGFYIDTDAPHHKAEWILKHCDGVRLTAPVYHDPILTDMVTIIVVDNGPFEAALIAYNKNEYDRALRGLAGRHVEYLKVPFAKAVEQCPPVAAALREAKAQRY